MRPPFLTALLIVLTICIAEAAPKNPKFADFLEPGFPFAEITVDARDLGEGFPADNLTPRGLVVRLGEDTYIAYDTDLCRVACAWHGGFLTKESLATMSYQKAKKKKGGGQKKLPSPIGEPIFANGLYPGTQLGGKPKFEDPRPAGIDPKEIGRGALPKNMARWQSIYAGAERVVIDYTIGDVRVTEMPELVADGIIVRHFDVWALEKAGEISIILGTGYSQLVEPSDYVKIHRDGGINFLTITTPSDAVDFLELSVLQSAEKIPDPPPAVKEVERVNYPNHWPESITVKGSLQKTDKAYAVDSIPLPINNPQRRNVRPSAIDFFEDGTAAICTFDGDVWMVNGLHGDLTEVVWTRVASGLHEPNAVRVINNLIGVFGRNGITLLSAGKCRASPVEVTDYMNICSDFWQSAETRDFAQSMDIASDESIFITKGGQQNDLPSKHSGRVLKISPDRKNVEVFASGLRNAYLTIRPGTDEIYASDQQGHWVPATPIHRIVRGGYYGFKPAAPWGVPEPPITPPLCWIPHAVAGSGLEPVWADTERFGPLSDSLVYLDYRRPGLIRTYLNDRKGQAATVPIPLDFDFPLLKGAINPIDGQLYLVGFQIWGTDAENIRGMARVRYTGKKSPLPTRVVAGKNAIILRFEQPLDPSKADFTVRRWNYQRSSNYGSGHFRPDGKAGEEILAHGGIEFSTDRRSVLVSTPELLPVHQLAVSYDLKTASGENFTNAAYLTLHETSALDLSAEGFPQTDLKKLAAQKRAAEKPAAIPASIERGNIVYQSIGCAACHSIDGTTYGKSGPTWKGLAGSQRDLQDGSTTQATTEYLRESILDPTAKVTKGYNPKDVGMPSYKGILSETDLESLVLFIEALKE